MTVIPTLPADEPAQAHDPSGAPRPETAALTPAAQAALEHAQRYAQKADAAATLRAYKADWAHYAAWCDTHGFVPVPAAPTTVGAYLASLGESHAPSTIRRRLAALGKMHRFNGLPWNPAHHDIQAPLRGVLRAHGRPAHKAPPLTLAMLRQLVATCDRSRPRPARPRAAAVRLCRRAAPLRAGRAAGRRRRRDRRRAAATNPRAARPIRPGRAPNSACRAAGMWQPARCALFEDWMAVAKRKAGPLFRRISTAGTIGDAALHPDAVRQILAPPRRDGRDCASTASSG